MWWHSRKKKEKSCLDGQIFNDLNMGSVWAKCFENVINETILFCVKNKGSRWQWDALTYINI